MIQLFKNIAFARKIKKEYGIKTNVGFDFNCQGRIRHNIKDKTDYKIYITISHWFSKFFKLTLMHEIGHALHKNGLVEHDMTAELAAWDFAFSKLGTITNREYGYYQQCISSYFMRHNNKFDIIYYMDVANKLVQKHFLNVSINKG